MGKDWEPPNLAVDEPPEGQIDTSALGEEMTWGGAQRTDAVVEEGNQLGQTIDVDDDYDNGGVPLEEPEPGEGVLEPVEEEGP